MGSSSSSAAAAKSKEIVPDTITRMYDGGDMHRATKYTFRVGDDPTAPNGDSPNLADDALVTEIGSAPGTKLATEGIPGFRTFDGPYGLGRVQMLGKVVRPYRRVITAQAFFRREVFTEQSQ